MCLIVPLLFHLMFIHSFFSVIIYWASMLPQVLSWTLGISRKEKKKSQKSFSLKGIYWQANNQINDLVNIIAICITKEEHGLLLLLEVFSCHNLLVTFSYLPAYIHARILLFELLFYTKYMWKTWKTAFFSFLEDVSTKCIIVCMFRS